MIGSRMSTWQLASAGPSGLTNSQTTPSTNTIRRKIFVAYVGSHVNPISLRSHFAEFGEIEDGVLGMDNATGKQIYSADKLLMVNVETKIPKSLPLATSENDNGNVGFGYEVSTAESLGLSGSYGTNTLSPSMMANYGLVAYQNPRGTSSAASTGS
ncbi:Nucleotide-binding, alpha-beta plait [Artemisia annua]|uniref:Nucleotide-binding, alpha-beta plait n=1 Tax=Artemisia annua TaxID=35608 RepID=A0A2U1KJF2_ARTAN|nr:Nucleotide-binding, alpha-beta plait [Artemisia annua]